MSKSPYEILGDQRKGVSGQCLPETFGVGAAPSPAFPADDVAGLETIATMLNPSTIAHHREVGGLYGWCELLQSRIRNAAAALSRLQARAEKAEEHIAVLETQITTVIISAEEHKARAEQLAVALLTLKSKIGPRSALARFIDAALGGQHGK